MYTRKIYNDFLNQGVREDYPIGEICSFIETGPKTSNTDSSSSDSFASSYQDEDPEEEKKEQIDSYGEEAFVGIGHSLKKV